jgi:PhoH-like ATPase
MLDPSEPSDQREEVATIGVALRRVVIDTSVLVADPHCLSTFDDAALVIPLIVVEELDSLKTRSDDVGRSARTALRAIEELRTKHGGSLAARSPSAPVVAPSRSRSTGSRSTASSSTGSTRRCPTTASSAPRSDSRDRPARSCCRTTPGSASRPPTSAWMRHEHEPTKRRRDERPVGWSVIDAPLRGDRLPVRRRTRSTPPPSTRPPHCRRTSSRCCAPARSRR